MRELTLLETGYLCGLLLFSLVLPLLWSFHGPRDATMRVPCMKLIWVGQAFLALSAVVVLASAAFAPYAAAFGQMSCVFCLFALRRQLPKPATV